jgi:hypothetical protein
MQQEFWKNIGPKSDDGGTLRRFLPNAEGYGTAQMYYQKQIGTLTLSAAGSPAKTSVTQDAAKDSKANEADCFSKPFAWFDNSDPNTCFWRTWQRCLLEGWTEFSGNWGRSGMTQNGIAYRLPPLVPRISGTGCSSSPELPTPKSSDAERGGRGELLALVRGKKTRQKWPTPSSRDWKDSPGMSKTGINPDGTTRERNDQLARRVYSEDQTPANGGQLNPTWVEWLMGFPLGWTDLEDWATQSCHK